MKIASLSLSALSACVTTAFGQALSPGSLVDQTVTFSEGVPGNNFRELENLSLRSYSEFEGEVVLTVYHASW